MDSDGGSGTGSNGPTATVTQFPVENLVRVHAAAGSHLVMLAGSDGTWSKHDGDAGGGTDSASAG
jgi:hypothetical protein